MSKKLFNISAFVSFKHKSSPKVNLGLNHTEKATESTRGAGRAHVEGVAKYWSEFKTR